MPAIISRQQFLQQSGLAAAALLTQALQSWAPGKVNKIKVAVIGCGSVSTQYLPHLSRQPYIELVSCCDIIAERAAIRAREYKIPNQYTDIRQLLKGAPFDLLVNLTDMQEHGRLNKMALESGKHVWSEKPLANSYAEGKTLVALANQKKLRLWGAPAVVNSPQFAFMAQTISEGKLGKIAATHAHYGHTGPTWSAFFYEKGGGSLPDLGVYNLATLTGLLGPARSLVAMTNIITATRKVDNKGQIPVVAEDNAHIIMEHQNGVLSHVQSGFNYFDPYGHEGKGQEKHTIQLWGTHGHMGLVGYDWAPQGVDLSTHDHEAPRRFVPDPRGYVWQEGASVVADALRNNTVPRINVAHALHVLELIEAARTASDTGRKVMLESSFPWPLVI